MGHFKLDVYNCGCGAATIAQSICYLSGKLPHDVTCLVGYNSKTMREDIRIMVCFSIIFDFDLAIATHLVICKLSFHPCVQMSPIDQLSRYPQFQKTRGKVLAILM